MADTDNKTEDQLTAEQKAAADAEAAKQAAAKAQEPAPAAAPAEQWEPSGDSMVDTLAKGYIEKGGSVAAFQALLDDVASVGTLTEAAKVELRKTFGDMAEALIPSLEAKAKANLEWVTKERAAVYAEAGSEAAFTKMQEWAAANLDAATRAFLSTSLNLGGPSAKLAVQQLRELMIKAGATVQEGTHKVEGAAVGVDTYISRTDYLKEKDKLHRAGDAMGIAALEARGRASIAAAEKAGKRWR